MIKVTDIMGQTGFYRCSPEGKIQISDDAKRWRIHSNFRGQRVNMLVETIDGVEDKLLKRLQAGEYIMGAIKLWGEKEKGGQ